MLNEKEKSTPLGSLRNWSYEEIDGGIRTLSSTWKDFTGLVEDPEKKKYLLSLLYFDTDSLWTLRLDNCSLRQSWISIGSLLPEIPVRSQTDDSVRVRIVLNPSESLSLLDSLSSEMHDNSVNLRLSFLLDLHELGKMCGFSLEQKKIFLKNHLANLEATICIRPYNRHTLAAFIQTLWDDNVHTVRILLDHLESWDIDQLEDVRAQWKIILEEYISREMDIKGYRLPDIERRVNDSKEFCGAGSTWIHVDEGGNIYPCLYFTDNPLNKNFQIGHIFCGLRTESHTFMEFSTTKMTLCNPCVLNGSCGNSCLWVNWRENKDFYTTPGSVCAYEKILRALAESVKERMANFKRGRYEDMCDQ